MRSAIRPFVVASWLTLTLLAGVATPAAQEEVIALMSAQSGRYVRAGVGENSGLSAVSGRIDRWEKFRVHRLPNDEIALQSIQSNKYVRAGVGEESLLVASSDRIDAWERFAMVKRGGDLIALRSKQNGKYVRAGFGQGSSLAAMSARVDAWETFRVVDPDATCTAAGQVTDRSKRGLLRFLGVSLYDPDGRYLQGRGATLDANGRFRTGAQPVGWYILRVTPAGKADPLYVAEPRELHVNCLGNVTGQHFAVR